MAVPHKTAPLPFDKICRACLNIKKDMRPLFEQLTATMLMGICKVEVAEGDGLPTQLCLQCVHQISRCYSFKELIERSDVLLREQLKKMEMENKPDERTLSLNCLDQGQFFVTLQSPPASASQLLEGFFTDPPDIKAIQRYHNHLASNEDLILSSKIMRTDVSTETAVVPAQDKNDVESDDESYMEMVAMQASSTVIGPGRHVCSLCHKEFKHSRWLKQHMKYHTNWIKANCKKPPMCNICQRTFKGPGMLKMHMRTHEQRPAKQPTCTVCQRVFSSKALLYRHRQTHFEQKMHQCTVCEKRFYSGYALRSHMARHRGERPYVCSNCNKSFYNPTDLKVHFRLHTGEKPLVCVECNKTFRRHSTLCQHMKKHRGIRNHICNVCNKGFYEVSKLNAHMRVHTGEKPYECSFCGRKFSQQSALIYHRRIHTGEKPYSCKICSAKFTTSSARNNHMVTHTGHKKFACPVCLKGCISRTELRVHSSKHTGEKLFGCELCDQRFSSASYLAVHRRYHTGEKKYVCGTCGKAYVESGSYKKHLKTHETKPENEESTPEAPKVIVKVQRDCQNQTDDNMMDPLQLEKSESPKEKNLKKFKCGECTKTYMHVNSLKKHMLTHSPQEQQAPASQVQQPQQHVMQQQQQQQVQPVQQSPQVVQMGNVPQITVPIQHVPQTITVSGVQGAQQGYPVISSVQSLQLQQSQHQVNNAQQQPQLQLQTIQIHPQHPSLQIHAVGMQQQQQLHVATSSCQTMLPNILQVSQLQPAQVGIGQQELHRIILQPQQTPATLYLHH